MFKKILPYTTLIVSALLLITAAIDAFSAITLFATIPFRLAVAGMLLLSLGVTFLACFSLEMRRPLILLACLLQTPIGGGMALVLLYDFFFPDRLQIDELLPLVTLLAALASVIQAAVMLLCKSIEADEYPLEEKTTYDRALPLEEEGADELSPTTGKNANTLHTVPVLLDFDSEDDLAPVPRKKQRKTPASAQSAAHAPAKEVSSEAVSASAIDLLSLLMEESIGEETLPSAEEDSPALTIPTEVPAETEPANEDALSDSSAAIEDSSENSLQ